MRVYRSLMLLVMALPLAAYGQSTPDDQVSVDFVRSMKPHTADGASTTAGQGHLGTKSSAGTLGVDSVVNWSSSFYDPGIGAGGLQYAWQYMMVGHSPLAQNDGSDEDWNGQTTAVPAPVIAVNLDLRNYDGSPRYVNGQRLYSDATKYVAPVLASPVFAKTNYDSSESPTQFTDAVQRAEFFHVANDDWHTMLKPRTATTRTLTLIRGTYRYALNSDGTCCSYVLVDYNTFANALFPATPGDTTTPIGAAEVAGDIRTRDIATFLFPNTFLYFGNPAACCVIGFHSYDVEPGDKGNGWRERRYVMNYSSWVSPGLFGDSFADITALSHELAETFNDPFVNNATPWWLAPNGNCQNNMETGDGIEGLPHAEYSITLNGVTYHPQNETLLPWFAGVSPSMAIHKAYSYPDTTVLTAAATPQLPGCPSTP